jgi:hypothetical protein
MTPTDIRAAHTTFTSTLREMDDHIEKLELQLSHAKNLREHLYTYTVSLDAARPLPEIPSAPPSEAEQARTIAGRIAPGFSTSR